MGPKTAKLFVGGNESKYKLWELKISWIPEDSTAIPNYTVTNKSKWQYGFCSKNATIFVKLIRCLDDKILSWIMRDAKDIGQKALTILREHYLLNGKRKVISLYTE